MLLVYKVYIYIISNKSIFIYLIYKYTFIWYYQYIYILQFFIWCYHYVIPMIVADDLIGSGPVKCWPMVCCLLLKSTFLLVGSHYVPFGNMCSSRFLREQFFKKQQIFEQKEHLAFHSTACLVSTLFRTGASRHSNPGTLVCLPGVTWFKVGFCIF